MIRNRLAQILDAGGLSTRFQPILEVGAEAAAGPSLHGLECLSRGPAGTVFESASVLFDYARRKQAEVIIDRECIALALRNARALASGVRLFLNVHASTLGRDDWFASFLAHQAEANGLHPRRLTLEILENSGQAESRAFRRNVGAVQEMGVNLAMDDVGLHYCNFGMLLDLSPAYLKLDMQLVRGCQDDPRRQAILRTLHQVALDLGANVIAEGIESGEELKVVRDIGIRYLQGFHFLPPLRPEEFAATEWAGLFDEEREHPLAAVPLGPRVTPDATNATAGY